MPGNTRPRPCPISRSHTANHSTGSTLNYNSEKTQVGIMDRYRLFQSTSFKSIGIFKMLHTQKVEN